MTCGRTLRDAHLCPPRGSGLVNRCCQVPRRLRAHRARHSIRWRRTARHGLPGHSHEPCPRAVTPWSQLASLRRESSGVCKQAWQTVGTVGWTGMVVRGRESCLGSCCHAVPLRGVVHVKTARLTSFHPVKPVTETRTLSRFCQDRPVAVWCCGRANCARTSNKAA